ncbi:DUF7522 family protein [Halorussus caseinilyticus]|uniref:Uncharacterized protein n=1 Tax=Halorussus caseinilyticus TaxID=3034025 RepID=A0ABD5WKD3_9EURY|nr:hypothetical protein [Halorussus sp. DT72]
MTETDVSEAFGDSLVSTCRTALGDTLRTVVYFTPEAFDVLYLRSDLYAGDPKRVRDVKSRFVDNERLGFDSQETYRRLHEDSDAEPDIGEYEFTIRVFSDGFVSRVIVGDHGVLLTTDSMDIKSFEELAISLRKLLADESS